jgi:hypothetical protein
MTSNCQVAVGVPTAVVAVLAAALARAEQATVVVKMQLLAATSDRLQVRDVA